jgi:hypothetical protein
MSLLGRRDFGEPKEHPRPEVNATGLPISLWVLLGVILVAILATMGFAIAGMAIGIKNDGGASATGTSDLSSLIGSLSDYLTVLGGSPSIEDCDTLIIGGGPGGLTAGYRLTKSMGDDLCIVNDRDYWGGKVFSYKSPASTNANPIFTPTHAEQFRAGDVILRCLAQELGLPCEARPSPISHFEAFVRSTNATNVDCYGTDETVTAAPSCDAGFATDRYGPNGDLPIYPNAPSFCNGDDWKTCSYVDAYWNLLMDANNANTITPGESWESYARRIIGVEASNFMIDFGGYPYPWTQPADAKQYVEYLKYDFLYPYGLLLIPRGGPEMLWRRVEQRILGNSSVISKGERVTDVSFTTGSAGNTWRYTAKTNLGNTVRAKRVVFAMPPDNVKAIGGTVTAQLKASKFVQKSGYNSACTWNGFLGSSAGGIRPTPPATLASAPPVLPVECLPSMPMLLRATFPPGASRVTWAFHSPNTSAPPIARR